MTDDRTATGAATTTATATTDRSRAGRIGDSPLRPDGTLKVTGEFAYASDLWHDEMVLGRDAAQPAPARPHPGDRHHRGADRAGRARRCSPPTTCPGENAFGLEHADQPVLAVGVRPLRGRAGGARRRRPPGDRPPGGRSGSSSTTRCCRRVTDAAPGDGRRRARRCTGRGNLVRHLRLRRGEAGRRPRRSSCRWTSRSACRTRPSSARSPGSPCRPRTAASTCTSPPSGCTSTSGRSASRSGMPPEKVRLTLSGVGGAFGGREDLSVHVHACLLALRTGRPVKMSYSREESFFGHVHRHPAWMTYEFGAETRRHARLRQGATSSSTAAPTPRRPPRSSATPGTLGLGPVPDPERRRRRLRGASPTTRRAGRCAASAACRPPSPTRR